MHDKHVAGRKVDEQIFGAPADAGHGFALEPLREILWQRPAQVAAVNLDLGEARPLHGLGKAAAHRLDFGKLGHRSSCR